MSDDSVAATALERRGELRWSVTLREDWALWGPAGGYLSALALRAAGEASRFPRPVSLCCQFLSLARFEPATLDVVRLRSGKRSEALRIDMHQDGKPVMTALG